MNDEFVLRNRSHTLVVIRKTMGKVYWEEITFKKWPDDHQLDSMSIKISDAIARYEAGMMTNAALQREMYQLRMRQSVRYRDGS